MYYTPDDLGTMAFKKAIVNGYSKSQVDDVLSKVSQDYISFVNENNELKNRIKVLDETVRHYKSIEESLQHSVIIAQNTSDTIKKNACEKAQLIIDDAELKAQRLIGDANQEVNRIKIAYEEIKSKVYTFKSKSEALIQSQMEILKQLFNE